MEIVCDSCASQLTVPADRLGDRGAKLKCPSCGVVLVIFPSENVAMSQDSEPTTEDWSAGPPDDPDARAAGDAHVPTAIMRLFAGERVHPPGTEPPVLRQVVPRAPEGLLSVTPPPPRAVRAPLTPTASVLRSSRPESAPLRPLPATRIETRPPPSRPGRTAEPPPRRDPEIAPPALLDGTGAGGVPRAVRPGPPPAAPSARYAEPAPPVEPEATQPPASERASAAAAQKTSPHVQNRTGPTGGATPLRMSEAAPQAQQLPPMSYAPPWGASWNTNGGPGGPPPFPGHPSWTPGAPPPWQPYPTAPGAPQQGPFTGTPAPMYIGPWTGTPAPQAGTVQGPPMYTAWQPTWMPAIMLGMERTTLAWLLAAVLVVGFAGSCLGVGTTRLIPSFDTRQTFAPPVLVPGTEPRDWSEDHRPRPVAPRPVPADFVRFPKDRTAVDVTPLSAGTPVADAPTKDTD
ncbi:MAG: zinc-ribbon domain-containing protein [Myxococcota bacterium]